MRGSKKAGPVKKRVMRGGGTAAKKAGPVKKLRGGGMTTKKMRSGGRNLRDEEARVIGVQDNAADEMRRVKARRPHDAAERRDKSSQESRVGSRERNAREEMRRLRGEAVGMGMNKGGKAKGGQATSPLTSQHKRYAMTGTTKLKTGGRAPMSTKIKKTKTPSLSPPTRVIQARGMGAAIRGGNFTENT